MEVLHWYCGEQNVKEFVQEKFRLSGIFVPDKAIPDEELWFLAFNSRVHILTLRRMYWFLGANGARKILKWPYPEDIKDDDWDPMDDVKETEFRQPGPEQFNARIRALERAYGNDY